MQQIQVRRQKKHEKTSDSDEVNRKKSKCDVNCELTRDCKIACSFATNPWKWNLFAPDRFLVTDNPSNGM